MLIEVPDEHGVVDTKFFGECSVEQLRKASPQLRRPTSSAPLPADTLAGTEQCRALLTGYFPERAGVRVEVHSS